MLHFFSINKVISSDVASGKGFRIPDSLIDTALKFAPIESSTPPEQLELFKQNSATNLIKQTLKDQIQNLIKPYLNFIPAVLALLLFISLQSIASVINLLLHPLLWIIFYVLEKTGFIKFTTEMRPVKKMVMS